MSLYLTITCVLLPAVAVAAESYPAITRPSKDVTLRFSQNGKIDTLGVRQGDLVKADQPLASLDAAAEQAQLKQLQQQAEQEIRVDAAREQAKQKELELARKEQAFKGGAVTELEVKQARLDVKIAMLSLDLAKFNRRQEQLKYEESKIRIDRMTLTSPIDGRVETVFVEKGESVEPDTKVVRVVNVRTLWIDIPVDTGSAADLAVGKGATVTFSNGSSAEGTIIWVASVADAASRTVPVRVEMTNTTNRSAGEHVQVSFPAESTDATANEGTKKERKS
ncbi:MAG: efflux RND transporter periplasmic adaptor subunit [Phycisphaerae bacterium]